MLAQAAQVTSPWWGTAVIAGAFARLGVDASQLVSYLNEDRKHERRLEADVRAACVRLLVLTKQLEGAKIPDQGTGAAIVDLANELRLIAPPAIVEAAQNLSMVVLVGQYGATWSEHDVMIKTPAVRCG